MRAQVLIGVAVLLLVLGLGALALRLGGDERGADGTPHRKARATKPQTPYEQCSASPDCRKAREEQLEQCGPPGPDGVRACL